MPTLTGRLVDPGRWKLEYQFNHFLDPDFILTHAMCIISASIGNGVGCM